MLLLSFYLINFFFMRITFIFSCSRMFRHVPECSMLLVLSTPFHLNSFFGAKDGIYYVAIATVICSRVKISSFRGKAHLVFHWCLYNKVIYLILIRNRHRFILRCTCVILIYFQLSLPSVSLACPPRAQD